MRHLRTATPHLAATAAATVALALIGPQAASAATIVAAPAGSAAGACTAAQPCSLVAAVRRAAAGDDVAVVPGTYDLKGQPTLSVRGDIALHGVPGQPRPTLVGDNPAGVLQVESAGAVVRHIAVEGVATVAKGFRIVQGTADDVVVHVSARLADACDLDGGVLRNSVCWASGAARSGVHMHAELADLSATVVGSTIVGPVGIREKVLPGRVGTLTVDSSIVMSSTGGPDIETKQYGEHHVITTNCNYDSVSGRGIIGTAVQSAPPALVDPAKGDFHELPGSPTVDAGSRAPGLDRGLGDIDGDARVMGAAVDIGADELPGALPATAVAPAPAPATAPAAAPPAQRAPVVWGVAVAPRVVRVARSARLRFIVDRATLVRVRVIASRGGRSVASVLVPAKPGANVVALPRRRAWRAGRYRVLVKPTGGPVTSTTFEISSARRRSRAAAR